MFLKTAANRSGYLLAEAVISFFLLISIALIVLSTSLTSSQEFQWRQQELSRSRQVYEASHLHRDSLSEEGDKIEVDAKKGQISWGGKPLIYRDK